MATGIPSNDDVDANTDDNHLETFCLIWLNTNVNVEKTRDTEQKLRSIINHLKIFEDIEQCQQYIEQKSLKEPLILIVSGRLGRKLVPLIHQLREVISIYIYCKDKKSNEQWSSKFSKVDSLFKKSVEFISNFEQVKGVVVKVDELIFRITADQKIQKKVEEPLSINIFSTNVGDGQSTIGLNGQFVFSQVLIDCILRLKYNQIDKNELIHLCQTEYQGNRFELNNLREFEEKIFLKQGVMVVYKRIFLL
jgi:hypothetical protein